MRVTRITRTIDALTTHTVFATSEKLAVGSEIRHEASNLLRQLIAAFPTIYEQYILLGCPDSNCFTIIGDYYSEREHICAVVERPYKAPTLSHVHEARALVVHSTAPFLELDRLFIQSQWHKGVRDRSVEYVGDDHRTIRIELAPGTNPDEILEHIARLVS